MNNQEEINALRDKISQYEKLLEKVMDGPFMESVVISQHNGLYRVMVNGNEVIIPKSPKLDENPKTGDKVMVNKNMIICILPEELEKPVKPVEFERIKWEQIGGLKSQISQIRDAIELPIKHPDYLKRMGLEPSRGVLLYGPPGCGKTMVAKAIASAFLDGAELNPDSFIYLKGGEMLSPYVGVVDKLVKDISKEAYSRFNGKLSGALIKGIVDKASYSIIREVNGELSESILTKIIKT